MIRAITIGLPIDTSSTSELEHVVTRVLAEVQSAVNRGMPAPRTLRFTLPPLGEDGEGEGVLVSRLRWVHALAQRHNVRWFCLPVDGTREGDLRPRFAAARAAIDTFDRLFLNLVVADDRKISVRAALEAANFIVAVSKRSNNGFDNFRVGASANCPPHAPFFPFSRHAGPRVAVSFALETTGVALEALKRSEPPTDMAVARASIVEALTPHLAALDRWGSELCAAADVHFGGLDASFAPFPAEGVSVAALIEHIVGAPIGAHGSVFASAFLTDALKDALSRAGATTTGFNGVMYSVLEDRPLATALNQRRLTLDTLLTLSTVCACGLDMIPVAGASFPEEIAATVLDVAALSCALDKPLGVRMLPIPGKAANEFTALNLDFLCDARVLELSANDRRFTATAPLQLAQARAWALPKSSS